MKTIHEAALKTIHESMVEEKRKKAKQVKRINEETLAAASAEPRRAGPWRVLEIFTWTCMVTMAAHYKASEAYEPITLPGWDLNVPEVKAKARQYLVQIDTD